MKSFWLFIILITFQVQASEVKYVPALPLEDKNVVVTRGGCPGFLQKWVEEDFSDKTSYGVKYKSEASSCRAQVEAYKNYLSKKNETSSFDSSQKLSKYLQDKYADKISPLYKFSLEQCNKLPHEKATAIQTRFYSGGAKIETANSSILAEVAHLDSVLPGSVSTLVSMECGPILPGIKKDCDAYRAASVTCPEAKQKRFDEMVLKTQKVLPEIEDLISAQHKCLDAKKSKEVCDPIGAVIELKKNQIPWVRGEDFQKLAVKTKAVPRNFKFNTEYDLSEKTLSQAITKQLTHNRAALVSSYAANLEAFRCLSDTAVPGKTCDVKKVRTHLQNLPDLRAPLSTKTLDERELGAYFDGETCLLERTDDRARTTDIVDSSLEGVALTLATVGVGAYVSGVRTVGTTSETIFLRQMLMVGNSGVNAAVTGHGVGQAYITCSEETKSLIAISKKSDVAKENICSLSSSALAQAREAQSHCLTTALLTAPSVLPLVGAVPSLKYIFKDNREKELQVFITNLKSSGGKKRDLDFAHNMTMEEKVRAAESVLGKPLTPQQKQALKEAHSLGAYDYAYKIEVLEKGGFSKDQATIIRASGLAGDTK